MCEILHKVFVYGTLKRGEPNQHWLAHEANGKATFVGSATTTTEYPLVIASKYNIPFLLDRPGSGKLVTGELYEIDEKMLLNLDVLEDHPSWYIREKRPFKLHGSAEIDTAWVYLLKTFRDSLLNLPFLEEYSYKGPHGLMYCEPAVREGPYDAREDVQGISKTKEE